MKRMLRLLLSCSAAALLGGCGSSTDSGLYERIENALTTFRQTQAGEQGFVVPAAVGDVYTRRGDHTTVAQGTMSLESDIPVETDTLFHIGSITKTFTAAWILQLDQEGKLSLSDTISKFFAFPKGDIITVRELLSHTSGVKSFTGIAAFGPWYKQHPYPTPQDILEFMRAHPEQSFEPGASYEYSNSNFYLLGLIGEAVTGRLWADEIKARFIEPYGLHSTFVYGVDEMAASPQGYLVCPASSCGTAFITPYGSDADFKLGWAAGAIVSTASDLAEWMRLLVAGPVLDEAHRKEMLTVTPQSEAVAKARGKAYYAHYKGTGLCLFNYYSERGGSGWGHDGQIGGFSNVTIYFPGPQTDVAIVSNDQTADVNEGALMMIDAALRGE